MNKKTTGIIAYITWIGWIVAFCAGDKEGAKFHLNQALVILIGQIVAAVINSGLGHCKQLFMCTRLCRWYCWHYLKHLSVCMLDHGSDLCLPGAGEGSSSDRPDQDFKIIKMTISHKKNPRCSLHRGFFLWVRLAAHVSVIIKNYSAAEAAAVSSAVVRFTSSGCSPCRKVMMIWIRL